MVSITPRRKHDPSRAVATLRDPYPFDDEDPDAEDDFEDEEEDEDDEDLEDDQDPADDWDWDEVLNPEGV